MAELDELFGNEKQTTMEPYSKDDWKKEKRKIKVFSNETQILIKKRKKRPE